MNIVLHQPEIPANTGNIGRTCVATGTRLHLIEPLGFRLNEKSIRRAGMDYWEHLDVTRYINYQKGFPFVTPPKIADNREAETIYRHAMDEILTAMQKLEAMELPREDIGMLLPLGMETKVVFRTNLRNLIDMAHQRMCTRAYWEYRKLMNDMVNALSAYSEEWKYLTDTYFVPKCEVAGFCTEAKCCGRKPKKDM